MRTYTDNGEGQVRGTASGTLPTTLMGAFGYDEFNLSVTCTADINISNTDIMFVLDVTGSMNCPDTSPGCGNNGNVESNTALIKGLRAAVMNFYDTVEDATSNSAQVRYGIVPYAPNVNVGFSIPQQYMATTHTIQSRVARFREEFTFIPGNGIEVGDEIVISQQNEWVPRNTANFNSSSTSHYRYRTSGTSARNAGIDYCFNSVPGTYTVNGQKWVISGMNFQDNVWSGGNSNNRSGCFGFIRKTRIATEADVIEEQNIRTVVNDGYTYCPVTTGVANQCGTNNPADSPAGWETVDLTDLYDDNRIMMPTATNGAMENLTWNGCIEEAETVNAANWTPIPAGANDLNINLVPTTEAQRWKPMLRDAVFRRTDSGGNRQLSNRTTTSNLANPTSDCPVPARRLGEITRTDLQTYVDGLRARGSTYHDIGMIWGARFITPRGIFRADNEAAPNGDAIGRHIVFMTDGLLQPNIDQYGTYGMEWWDRRVTANGSTDVAARHNARFLAACRAARQENITVWVVSFGLPLTAELNECASPGRAYEAADNAALTAAFREIAQKIAALRLTS
ncbi:MAG: hypothetical protein NWP98_10365 [Erythrobacter sp.]|nr:hypothetical protein [Erythrobacter sp.]